VPRTQVSSTANPTIKRIIALRDRRSVRYAERLFVLEGPRFVWDAAHASSPQLLVGTAAALDQWDIAESQNVIEVTDDLFRHVTSTESPQGVLGVFQMPELKVPTNRPRLAVIADGVQDPGNLGTLMRSAVAFRATELICLRGTVDPYSPKVVRAAAGAHFSLPVSLAQPDELPADPGSVVIADERADLVPSQFDWTRPLSLVVGGEARGVSDAILARPHTSVAIPMAETIESLNAGVAASILLYEADRQRRSQSPRR
jgi:TrmH family RNA methyltransferase